MRQTREVILAGFSRKSQSSKEFKIVFSGLSISFCEGFGLVVIVFQRLDMNWIRFGRMSKTKISWMTKVLMKTVVSSR